MSDFDGFGSRAVYTVSGFAREVRQLLETSYPQLWIEGEITNLSTPASGHCYFSIKDDGAQIRCALFRQRKLRCAVAPKDGAQVLIRARVSLYEARGDFQLIVEYMEDAGEGALRRRMEALKRRLVDEGLFDPEHKRPIPELPRTLGVITSPSGAALRDVLVTLRRTASWLPVIVYPVPVQGEAAAPAIVKALATAARRAECDVLILARGGGSLEDLMAFNDEAVARAVFDCPIPVVSGVGHETDTTIVDFVADVRAPTPTAAAQLVGGAGERLTDAVDRRHRQLTRAAEFMLQRANQDLDRVAGRIRHPLERIRHQLTRVDHLRQRLAMIAGQRVLAANWRLEESARRVDHASPRHLITERTAALRERTLRLPASIRRRLASDRARLDAGERQLGGVSPTRTLARGYAILTDRDSGAVISRANMARVDQPVGARLVDGSLELRVTGVEAGTASDTDDISRSRDES